MAKGIIGGMTDYSHQSFSDILQDLQSEQRIVSDFIGKIEKNLQIVTDNGFWKSKVISNFKIKVAYSIKHYKTVSQELIQIADEIQFEVKEHHCKRLEKISEVAQEINVDIGRIWNQDYEEYGIKDYDDPNFRIVENIYADTRDVSVNLLDMSNIAERLKDFIGKTLEKKRKFKLELGHKIGLGALVVAIIVMLFGNNIWGRFKNKNNSEIKAKSETKSVNELKPDTLLKSYKLPYLENVPIIDKGLFIKYYYNNFVISGVNIDTISIGARSKSGESLNLFNVNREIRLDITQEPFIEFDYKGTLYSIEISGRHYLFFCTLIKNVNQTLRMKKYKEI